MDFSRVPEFRLRATMKTQYASKGHATSEPHKLYDVKFYPYQLTSSPIFAVVGVRQILICRPPNQDHEAIVVLRAFSDREATGIDSVDIDTLNCCEWNFIDKSQPLLSVAGASGQVKVLNALTGGQFTTLNGHGVGIINDVATHPLQASILASGSMDSSIRIWDLRRCLKSKVSPCIIVCGHGQGHREGILSISWHSNGRYLISGAHDQMICVWTIPDLSDESSFWDEIANPKRSAEAVRIIHYPHFVTTAIHSNYVDCVQFYGDLILSKAAEENKIVLWKINGFNSRLSPPTSEQAPKTKEYLDTRNGFLQREPLDNGQDLGIQLYERNLEFAIPNSELFYMRFGLLQASLLHPDLHPILAFGNLRSKIFFWDLERLGIRHDHEGITPADKKGFSILVDEPHKPLKSQLEVTIVDFPPKKPEKSFQARGIGWSPCGRWCVAVGESAGATEAVAAVFERCE